MVKRRGMFQKFVKTKQNEVKLFKILQDRSKTNVFVSNCVEEKKGKTKLCFLRIKAKKNEYNRSSTIKDLPLLRLTLTTGWGGGGGGGWCGSVWLTVQTQT
jgi:hypothetical protein